MAESPGQERTEPATPRRRQQAREEGNVPRSMEVISVVVLFTGLIGLTALGPRMVELGGSMFTRLWPDAGTQELTQANAVSLARELGWLFAAILAPFVGMIAVAGIGANVLQTGIMLSLKPIAPKANRISPATGLKRIFSKRGAMELIKSLIKIAVVAGAVAWAMFQTIETFFPLISVSLGAAYGHIVSTMIQLAGTAALALTLLAILDFWFQRYEHEEQLKMTRQQVKDEYKQNEGDPQLKGKLREKQRQMSRQRMMQDVATADVIVTNPNRFAVALKYDPTTMKAPRVVAKGARLLARRIRDLARENDIPVIENAPLARALYKAVQVGSDVPISLYQAVAEVLAFIWRRSDGVAAAAGGAR